MKEVLIEAGWYQYHQCTCGGTLKQSFKHPNKPKGVIKIKPNKNTWEYFIGKTRYGNGVGVDTLKTKIDEL